MPVDTFEKCVVKQDRIHRVSRAVIGQSVSVFDDFADRLGNDLVNYFLMVWKKCIPKVWYNVLRLRLRSLELVLPTCPGNQIAKVKLNSFPLI